jgi:hypothetical protein
MQKRAIRLACLAALGLAGSAHAVQVAGEALEIYANLYPQYQTTSFGDGSTGATSTMTAGLNTPVAGTGATKVNQTQVNWVNSYLAFKGQKAFGDVRAGFDLQGVVMKNGTLATETAEIGEARDAYLFIAHNAAGTFQIGQMDTIYKEFGDRVRQLGISSGNINSSSTILSGVTWKSPAAGVGTTSFNTRINGQIRWVSPNWNGVQLGYSHRPDPLKSATTDASLSAMGARWSNATYYVGLAQEVHNDYRTVSGSTAADAATTIFSVAPRSKDTATRLSFGYTAEQFRIGADVASLEYTEAGTIAGNFESYKTTAWQVSGEYAVSPQVTLGAIYGVNGAGTCSLIGGGVCTSDTLGGTLLSIGARYDYDKSVGLFAIFARNTVGDGAVLASGTVGGAVTNMAVGVNVRF